MALKFSIRKVTELTDADRTALYKVLADAFAGSVPMQTLAGGNAELGPAFAETIFLAAEAEGEVYLAENDADGAVIGGAAWFPPGSSFAGSDEQKELIGRFIKRLSPEAQEWWPTMFIPTLGRLEKAYLTPEAKLNSWHLQGIATGPEFQRKGVATALVAEVETKAAQAGNTLAVEVATTLNVEIFKKLGWKTQGAPVQIVGLTSEFSMWPLTRDPTDSVD